MADAWLRVHRAVWKRLTHSLRDSRAGRRYGAMLHERVRRSAKRQQYFGTFFLRNRPALEQMSRLVRSRSEDSALKMTVLGCSNGAEVYSILWALHSARPDLEIITSAVDVSDEILTVARRAVYTAENSELLGRSIFERMTAQEREEMFDWKGDQATVKPHIREGVSFHLGDAADPHLLQTIGLQEIVVASNFLCHMRPEAAEACLRNVARLVRLGGHLFVVGVDLDVRAKVARELAWRPVPDLIREIHDGDPSVRQDWPWAWWGLEPLDDTRHDWPLRYAVAYRLG